jgi:VCBS repeat-containing protein
MSNVYYSLGSGDFVQNWTDTGAISANDDWSGIPSIVGYRTGDATSATGVDARTITTDTGFVQSVLANQAPTSSSGGVLEVDRLTGGGAFNPTIALQGSNNNDYAAIVLHLDASGRQNVTFNATIRDLDASADNAAQQIVVQYRIGSSGEWTNVYYNADVTIAGATQAIPITVTLPAEVNNQSQVQVRILTANAAGNDELVGIDDILVTSTKGDDPIPDRPGEFSIGDAAVIEGNAGTTAITFTVTRGQDSNVAASVDYSIDLPGGANGASASDFASPVLAGTLSFAAGEFSKTITLNVNGDLVNEANETFTVTLANATNGALIADGSATGTITNDDAAVAPGVPFINEIHYDNAGTDAGEAIEIAAAAGTSLAGWSLVLYSVSTGATQGTVYNTKLLSGIVPDQDDGYGTISFSYPSNGIQNGTQDGVALVDPQGNVVQFLSYEGAFVAQNGPAAGMTATDIGVEESSATPAGFSLQLAGSGASAADFTWVSARDDNFGAVNSDQDFIGPNGTGRVAVADASVVEGDAGTTMLVFTVTRAGGLGQSAGVDWMLGLPAGGADKADLAAGQALSGTISFGVGVSSVQIAIAVNGDTVGEGNEALTLLLANPTGNIAITDASATGTILNDDPISLAIYEIQGAGHRSDYAGQPVATTGIVTAVAANGFYLQDPTGDGDFATSDAIFVFTRTPPTVAVGDGIEVRGRVAEFLPGGNPVSLTITQIENPAVTVTSTGNALPAAVLIGTGGINPPTEVVDDDNFATFDPLSDGIDFYEALEGMRVTIDAPLVVANTTSFGETWVVASGGAGATGLNARGGMTISAGDFNPERIQLEDGILSPGYIAAHTQGDRLADVTGIMSYGFNSPELLVTGGVTVTSDVTLGREATALRGDRDHLTVGSYNVENLDPTDAQAKFDLLAKDILYSLGAPDILALQEVQDADGAGNGSDLSGQATAAKLIAAIVAAGGPEYVYVEVAPGTAGSSGGEPGGNIRNGYLYNPERVDYVTGSAALIQDPAYNGTRKPLVADFTFNGETVRLINVHFTSRGGSDPLFGADQPPANEGEAARIAQGQAVAAYINSALATDPSLKLGVLGDFNGFYFEDGLRVIEGDGVMTNLYSLLPAEERYSYLFDGNLQALDNFLVSGGLLNGGVQFDAVHINAEQLAGNRATDHDPSVGRFFIEAPNAAPTDLVIDDNAVAENAPAGTVVGTLSANDIDPEDELTYTLIDDANGLFTVDAATGVLRTTQPLNYELASSYTILAKATDPDGASTQKSLTIVVTDVNEAPVASADAVAVNEDATSDNLWSLLLGNDSDPDNGQTPTIASVSTTGTLGTIVFDAATKTLRYIADHDSFDSLAPGASVVDTFTYTVTDAAGLTSTATVSVTVTGIADGVRTIGGNGHDNLLGTGGEDLLTGGNGNDVLQGLGGHDVLFGNNGVDTLFGGDGNDVLAGGNGDDFLAGGAGKDGFFFARGGGKDTILDFDVANDRILLDGGIGLAGAKVGDVNGDGIADLTLAFTKGGGSAVLLGVGDLSLVTIVQGVDENQLASQPLI